MSAVEYPHATAHDTEIPITPGLAAFRAATESVRQAGREAMRAPVYQDDEYSLYEVKTAHAMGYVAGQRGEVRLSYAAYDAALEKARTDAESERDTLRLAYEQVVTEYNALKNGEMITVHEADAMVAAARKESQWSYEDAVASGRVEMTVALSDQMGAMRQALVMVRDALSVTSLNCGNGYDWNADPQKLTLKQGEAFAAIAAALAPTDAAPVAQDDAFDALIDSPKGQEALGKIAEQVRADVANGRTTPMIPTAEERVRMREHVMASATEAAQTWGDFKARVEAAVKAETQPQREPPYIVPVELWCELRQRIIDSNDDTMIELVAQVERANTVPTRDGD